jgi:hypothetical protein
MEKTTLLGRLPKRKFDLDLLAFNVKKGKSLEIIVYFFIVLFIYAGLRKLIDYKMYWNEIYLFPIMTKNMSTTLLSKIAGFIFPVISIMEIITSIFLFFPKKRSIGLYLSFSLLLCIIIYLLAILHFSKLVPMYFGGILPNISLIEHIAFSMILMFIALFAIVINNSSVNK